MPSLLRSCGIRRCSSRSPSGGRRQASKSINSASFMVNILMSTTQNKGFFPLVSEKSCVCLCCSVYLDHKKWVAAEQSSALALFGVLGSVNACRTNTTNPGSFFPAASPPPVRCSAPVPFITHRAYAYKIDTNK